MAELRTGWEPDTPDEDILLRQAVRNFTDFNVGMSEASGGRVRLTDDLAFADLGRPTGFLNNATFLRPPRTETRFLDLADEIDEYFGGGSGNVDVWSAWPTPDFRERGWELGGHPPLMLRAAGGKPPPPPDDLEIRGIRSVEDLGVFEDVLATSFGNPGAPHALENGVLDLPWLHAWLGFVDGKPACTASVGVTRGVNGVQAISTLPEFRGRGLGEAITWIATTKDPDLPAVLLASDLGRPVYERMGYVALVRFHYWRISR